MLVTALHQCLAFILFLLLYILHKIQNFTGKNFRKILKYFRSMDK